MITTEAGQKKVEGEMPIGPFRGLPAFLPVHPAPGPPVPAGPPAPAGLVGLLCLEAPRLA